MGEMPKLSKSRDNSLVHRDTLIDFFHDLVAMGGEFLVYDDGFRKRSFTYEKVGRAARGVRIFRLAKDGRVVSVAHLGESANGDDESSGEADEEAPSEADGEGEKDTQE